MRRIWVALGALISLALLSTAPAMAATRFDTHSGMTVITAALNGQEAVPAGDPDGSGRVDLVVGPGDRVCFRLVAQRIMPITGVHIHEAVRGLQGPHAIDLFGPDVVQLSDGTQVFRGCVAGGAKVADLLAHPERFYVNVHTHEFPLGALRAQLG